MEGLQAGDVLRAHGIQPNADEHKVHMDAKFDDGDATIGQAVVEHQVDDAMFGELTGGMDSEVVCQGDGLASATGIMAGDRNELAVVKFDIEAVYDCNWTLVLIRKSPSTTCRVTMT